MEEENKVVFEGVIGDGMPTPEQQFENSTGMKFNSEEYEIEYSGAEGDEYSDSPATPFKIVKRQEKEDTNKQNQSVNEPVKIDDNTIKNVNKAREETLGKIEELENWLQLHGPNNRIKGVKDLSHTREYEEVKQELNARKSELAEINSILQYQQLLKLRQERVEALKKCKDQLNKVDKNKDPQLYKEGLEELKARESELQETEGKIKGLNDIDSKLKKYNIKSEKKIEQSEVSKSSKLEKKEIGEINKIKNEEKEKEYTKIHATQDEIDRYTDLINKGYSDDSPEMMEFFKQVAKERELKFNPVGARDENGNLKYPLNPNVKQKQTVERNSDGSLKYPLNPNVKQNIERNSDGSLKYPLNPNVTKNDLKVDSKVDSKEASKDLEIIYMGKENAYIVNNYEEILANASFDNEKEKLTYVKTMTQKFRKPIPAMVFKNKKEKMEYLAQEFTEEDLEDLFESKKEMKKIAKICDPQLLVMLSDLDMDYAKKYIQGLQKDKDDEKEELPYKMKYNLKGMRKNHKKTGLSFIERFRKNSMAKANYKKGVAEYVPDDKNRKWLAVPVIGVLAAGGLTADSHTKDTSKEQVSEKNEISDTYVPEVATSTTEQEVTTDTTKQETIGETDITSEDIENAVDEELENMQSDDNNLVLGSTVTMPTGITYTENSLGEGRTGTIGQNTPAGTYTVDRVALWYNDKLLVNLGDPGTDVDATIKEYADNLGIDASEIKQVAHICAGENHDEARGWINMEEMTMDDLKDNVSKSYDELQQEKEAEVEEDMER